MDPECLAVLVGAGEGLRLGRPGGKMLAPLAGRPLFLHALDTALSLGWMRCVAAVLRAADLPLCREAVARSAGGLTAARERPELLFIEGGPSRQDSVRRGLESLAERHGAACRMPVLVHDLARPLASAGLFRKVAVTVSDRLAVAPAVAVTDSLRATEASALPAGPVPREGLVRVQTPQGWIFAGLLAAHRRFQGADPPYPDDLSLAADAGAGVQLIPGEERNLKVTSPEDLALAGTLLGGREPPRTGIGFDIHPLVPGQSVRLGGVEIPCAHRLDGHSDADVVAHAAMDAILGAAAMGDIGGLFPPGDPRWSGADSIRLLGMAWQRAQSAGYELVNLDVSVLAEAPRLSPHYPQMRANLAAALGCDPSKVNVKATTCEGLGAVGRGEGIAAMATATIRRAGES